MRVNFFLLLEQSLAEQSKLYPQSYPQFSLLNFVILETIHWLGNFIEPFSLLTSLFIFKFNRNNNKSKKIGG